jgi:plastocyanin
MEHRELFARMTVGFILLGLPGLILGYQHWLRPEMYSTRMIDIRMAAPEAGGFSTSAIRMNIDESVTLRFSSSDVTHGIAIGPGIITDSGYIDPGDSKEIALSFDQPGTYTFYCNVWCSPNHWRMRGVIEVHDPENPDASLVSQPDPIMVGLQEENIDIDAERAEYNLIGDLEPSISKGMRAIETLSIPPELWDEDWKRHHTPAEAVEILIDENSESEMTVIVDTVAYLWIGASNWEQDDDVVTLYNQNCAACHGQAGTGDGPAAESTAVEPVAFSDPAYMFLLRSDVLYAKIRRGGMGTDMPNFGTLFTQDETWALVDYLWALLFSQDRIENIRQN